MEIKLTNKFLKDVSKITNKKLVEDILASIENVKLAKTLLEIKNIKPLTGFKKYYRIKIGDYRIGIYFNSSTVEFARFLDRKEIYRYFP